MQQTLDDFLGLLHHLFLRISEVKPATKVLGIV